MARGLLRIACSAFEIVLPGGPQQQTFRAELHLRSQSQLGEMLLEEGERPLPGQIGRGLVVTLRRRVVVEGVVHAVIEVELHRLLRGPRSASTQGKRRAVDAVVQPRVMDQQGACTFGASDGSGAGP